MRTHRQRMRMLMSNAARVPPGALPAMVESLGDYFAAAAIAGAPVPPPGVISRAVALQGATCALAGAWGTTSGTTAYNEVRRAPQPPAAHGSDPWPPSKQHGNEPCTRVRCAALSACCSAVQNIGAMQITRVGSRRVIQLGAACAIIMGLIG